MNKNINSNLNNKFGICCDCPALMSGNMYFTNFESSRIYNDSMQKKLQINDSHTYRLKLQNDATKIIKNETMRFENNRCKTNDKNKFYIDSSKYNFNEKLKDEYLGPGKINFNEKLKDEYLGPGKNNFNYKKYQEKQI